MAKTLKLLRKGVNKYGIRAFLSSESFDAFDYENSPVQHTFRTSKKAGLVQSSVTKLGRLPTQSDGGFGLKKKFIEEMLE